MKITKLDLRAVGPFTDVVLDFPADGPGFHLIYGPNEAGKSSALRAIKYFLFKFPHTTSDDHVHKYTSMRVGATVVGADGVPGTFVRRKAVKALWDENDASEVAESELTRRLGGMDESRFRSIYQSTLAELIKGGKDLIEGKGDFGDMLFSASGMSRLPDVRKTLEAEAETLFKGAKAAKNPRINATLIELETARKTAQEKAIPPAAWAATNLEREETRAKAAATRHELDRAEAERRRLERIGQAIPLLADRREAMAQLREIGDVPRLSEGFNERRINALAARDANEESAQVARGAIKTIEDELAAIEVPERLLDEAGAINKLREEIGGLRKARERRPRLVERSSQTETTALAMLRDIAPGRSLDDAESLRLGKAQKSAIQSLGLERSAIDTTVKAARDQVRALSEALADREILDGPEARRKLDDLAALVDRISRTTDPQTLREAALGEVRRLETEAAVELARLPRWSGTLDDLAGLPVPAEASIESLDRAVAEAQAELKAVEKSVRAKVAEIRQLDEEASGAGSSPPTDADLARSRQLRAESWRDVRRAWLEGDSTRPSTEIAITYEHFVGSADDLADALRRESERVAAHLLREARRTRLVAERDSLDELRLKAMSVVEKTQFERDTAWRSAGVEPGSPAEMRSWSAHHRQLLGRAAAIREKRLEADRLAGQLTTVRDELAASLVGLGQHTPTQTESLASLLDRARAVIDRGEQAAELRAARGRLATAETRLAEWQARWGDAVRSLGLDPKASPELANDMIERLDGFFGLIKEARKTREEIAVQDGEAFAYERLTRDLAKRIGVVIEADSAEAIAEALATGLAEAERARDRRKSATARLKAETARLVAAESAVRDQKALLAALCREAGCESPDDLPEIERRSIDAMTRRSRLEDDERRILAIGAGADLAEIARQAEEIIFDELPARLRELSEQIDELTRRVDELNREDGRLKAVLDQMDGGSAASDANAQSRQFLAQIEGDVEQYARLKLASAVLRKAIDRYREEHQGPILKRLGGLFARLTVGSFAGVELDEDSDAKVVLKGVRPGPNGERVAVDGMSLGTADALYLAVRLATLEMYLDAHEPMPFIVDDILVQFDDARASAALVALARLSERTQVLFFTHHKHVIDLAHDALPRDAWSLHELPRRAELALTAPG
jgi:uncharacterized protein YhaN